MFHTVSVNDEVMQKIQKIQRIFIDYTGEETSNWPEEKVIDFLADGFLAQIESTME